MAKADASITAITRFDRNPCFIDKLHNKPVSEKLLAYGLALVE
jgi:hypothetical protein